MFSADSIRQRFARMSDFPFEDFVRQFDQDWHAEVQRAIPDFGVWTTSRSALDRLYILCTRAFRAVASFERNLLTFSQRFEINAYHG